jgi:methionyl aminopeptidase
MIKLKTEKEIEILKQGGKILADILLQTKSQVKVGTSTKDLNDFAHNLIIKSGARSSFLNYTPDGAIRPFPASICVCINEEIVHGIPNENPKIIKDGDLVTLDCGIIYKELFTDHAISFFVGENNNADAKRLLQKTEEALYAGIKQAKIGNKIGDIGHAISQVAFDSKLSVVNDLSGHGVGYEVHEDPYVPNYGDRNKGEDIEEGLVIAIEPMFSLGKSNIKIARDGYTYITKDNSLSAQFEHTVAVTKQGPIILTRI